MSIDSYLNHLIQLGQAMRLVWRRGIQKPPAAPSTLPFRGPPALREDDDGQTRCTACRRCVDACPTHCIVIQGQTAIRIDIQRCMHCAICVLVCPEHALQTRETGS